MSGSGPEKPSPRRVSAGDGVVTVLSMILAAVVALVLFIALGYLALLGTFFVSPDEL